MACGPCYGIPFPGYRGFRSRYGHSAPLHLRDFVLQTAQEGGSILGSSRGPQSKKEIVDFLVEYRINVLFVIGGDGTLRGAQEIVAEIASRDLKISVVGIPKTIDNDLEYMDKSFGFETAFAEAVRTVRCAHSEAQGYPNGVGLVKLMGRDSGFIAINFAAHGPKTASITCSFRKCRSTSRANTACSHVWKIAFRGAAMRWSWWRRARDNT